MADQLIQRLKSWVGGEDVYASALEAEFQNILDNLYPAKIDDVGNQNYTFNASGTPASLKEELGAIRYMIQAITDGSYWYSTPDYIAYLGNLINGIISSGVTASGGSFIDCIKTYEICSTTATGAPAPLLIPVEADDLLYISFRYKVATTGEMSARFIFSAAGGSGMYGHYLDRHPSDGTVNHSSAADGKWVDLIMAGYFIARSDGTITASFGGLLESGTGSISASGAVKSCIKLGKYVML